jgi:hypothetical protein
MLLRQKMLLHLLTFLLMRLLMFLLQLMNRSLQVRKKPLPNTLLH